MLLLLQVDNTDAEGRLTLADALVYACNQGVDKVTSSFTLSCADDMVCSLVQTIIICMFFYTSCMSIAKCIFMMPVPIQIP